MQNTCVPNHKAYNILNNIVPAIFKYFVILELAIQFSNSTFSGLESSGIISVTLILEGGTSASVITLTVQPFDQSPVSAQGKI